jgi:hypothetical protein
MATGSSRCSQMPRSNNKYPIKQTFISWALVVNVLDRLYGISWPNGHVVILCFGGTYRLRLQGGRVDQGRSQHNLVLPLVLQVGRSRIRDPDETNVIFFLIYIILPAALGPGVHSASNRSTKLMFLESRTRPAAATDPEVRVRFPVLPDFLRSSGSETGSTQPREYN